MTTSPAALKVLVFIRLYLGQAVRQRAQYPIEMEDQGIRRRRSSLFRNEPRRMEHIVEADAVLGE